MPDLPTYQSFEAQLDMWRDCKPQPDSDGLFDVTGVAWIAGRRRCAVSVQSDLVLTVVAKAAIQLVAIAPGRWDPVAILTACTTAQGRRAFEVDVDTARIENRDGLDEVKIARIVGADGLRAYLSKRGKYGVGSFDRGDRRGSRFVSPLSRRLICEVSGMTFRLWSEKSSTLPTIAANGQATWAFREVLEANSDLGIDHVTRRGLRALSDVGLLSIKPGPRGGMSRAKFTWTKRAYLPPTLSLYVHDAIAEIAAGLV